LVAINVAVVVEAEAGCRPAETVPCEVVSTVFAAADIASTATAISKMGDPVATGGPRATCGDAKARTVAARPRPGTTPAAALQCSCATAAHSAAATSGHPAATAAAAPATSGHSAATVAAAASGPAATVAAAAATTTGPAATTVAAAPATSRPAAVFGAN
jgi:hypothetical protein